jgi:hypothetical protein
MAAMEATLEPRPTLALVEMQPEETHTEKAASSISSLVRIVLVIKRSRLINFQVTVATGATLAQEMRLPMARVQRLTQVTGAMHRVGLLKIEHWVMDTSLVVYSMSHLVCIHIRPLELEVANERITGNGGNGGDASSGGAVAVSDSDY